MLGKEGWSGGMEGRLPSRDSLLSAPWRFLQSQVWIPEPEAFLSNKKTLSSLERKHLILGHKVGAQAPTMTLLETPFQP